MEILSRLPVRSLQRFKCVSTFWEALISDPYFKMTHLNNAKNDPNSQKFLSAQRYIGKDDMFTFYCSSLSLSSVQVFEDVHKLDCPSNCKPLCAWIFASCDGLVLLQVTDTIDDQLLLWNPSTRESIMLPYPQSTVDYCVCGFGYDTTTDDYKILLINLEERSNQNISVEILALKSGCWRNIGKYPSGMSRVMSLMGSGIDTLAFVHGVFHWVGLSQNYTIISFNISNEVYGEMALLKQMCSIVNPDFVQYGTAVFRGMLCFYSTHNGAGLTFRMDVEHTFKLWVMKDYGVKESWTQLLTIKGTNYFYSAIPKYMFVDGEVLLYCRHLLCGGVVCKTSRGPFGLWPEGVINKKGIVYTESLISPRLLI